MRRGRVVEATARFDERRERENTTRPRTQRKGRGAMGERQRRETAKGERESTEGEETERETEREEGEGMIDGTAQTAAWSSIEMMRGMGRILESRGNA